MKQSAYRFIGAAGALAMALHMAPAFSSRPPIILSGTVTAVEARTVVVDGVSYPVQLQGSVLGELAQLHVGDRVQLVLNGPRGAAATQVSSIHVHVGR